MEKKVEVLNRYNKSIFTLSNKLMNCWRTLNIIKRINELAKNQSCLLEEFEYLFLYLYNMSNEYVFLNFTNIVVHDRESISIHYLSQFYNSEARRYFSMDQDKKLSDLFTELTAHYSSNSQIINNLRLIRDKSIAHIDKKQLFSPNLGFSKITYKELDDELSFCWDKLHAISDYSGLGTEFLESLYYLGFDLDIGKLESLLG